MNKNLKQEFEIINLKLQFLGLSKECHTNTKLCTKELIKLGYPATAVRGIYYNAPNKIIIHSWIEIGNQILETDCRQLREECDIIPDVFCAVLPKSKFKHRYRKQNE